MKKIFNTVKIILKVLGQQYFYVLGILWMLASFLYIGEPQFWNVLGFGVIFTGIQSIINEIKLN